VGRAEDEKVADQTGGVRRDGFRPEFLDFQRGIRVGHLEPHERITQILKLSLEKRYRQHFVTDRWGRGVYWQWICFLPKANRQVKPISSKINFGCAKFFIMIDRGEPAFKTGMQVERGFIATAKYPECCLREDWDWHRLLTAVEGSEPFWKELGRLAEEGFQMQAGSWDKPTGYSASNFPSRDELLQALNSIPPGEWGGFQLYYSMPPAEVGASTGVDLIEAILAVFAEVTPAMNACMELRV
jgi:hypothetical protein